MKVESRKSLSGLFILSGFYRLSHRPFKVITEQLREMGRKLVGIRIIIFYGKGIDYM